MVAAEAQMYQAFGLGIQSSVSLPGLAHGNGPTQVEVRFGAVPFTPPAAPPAHPLVSLSETDAIFYWDFVGAVRIEAGARITVDPVPEAVESAVAQAIQGVAMGTLLFQRGATALHASAVSIHGKAVAFLGRKGAGKSTTAAALHAQGYPLVTDDILVIDSQGQPPRPFAYHGTVALKLWPEAVTAAYGDDPESLEEVYRNSVKRVRPVDAHETSAPLPLGAVYLLEYHDDGGDAVRFETMSVQEATLHFVQHSYAQRMLGRRTFDGNHLRQCAELANRVPVKRVTRRRSLEELRDFVDAIALDVSGLSSIS